MDRLRLLSFNMAHGRGLAMNQVLVKRTAVEKNLSDIGNLIAKNKPHVVALQEIDQPSLWVRSPDQLQFLSEATGMRYRLHGLHSQGKLGSRAGTALLSHFPLRRPRIHHFNSTWRDNKGFVSALVRLNPGKTVRISSVHLDFINAKVRHKQIKNLIGELSKSVHDNIIMGDFNCDWHAPACVKHLAAELGLKTHAPTMKLHSYPSTSPSKRLDWVLVSQSFIIEKYITLNNRLSDHLPVYVELSWKHQ